MDENPGVKFGEISRIVAERWRGMSDADKQVSESSIGYSGLSAHSLMISCSGLCRASKESK